MKKDTTDEKYLILVILCSFFMYHVNVWSTKRIWDFFTIAFLGITLLICLRRRFIHITFYFKWLVSIIVISTVVSLIQPYRENAFGNMYNLIKAALPALIVITFTDSYKRIEYILLSLWISGIAVFFELMMNFNANAVLNTIIMTQSRMGLGGVEHPNTTAYNLLISFIVGSYLLFTCEWIKNRKAHMIIMIIGEGLIAGGCLLTGSRKVLIGILIVLLLIAIRNSQNPIKLIGVISVIIIGIYMLYQITLSNQILYTLVGNRLESLFEGEDASSDGRKTLIAEAVRIGFVSVIGVGFGNYKNYSSLGMYAHNELVEIFSGTGMAGLVIYYFPIIKEVGIAFKNYYNRVSQSDVAWFAIFFTVFVIEFSQITYTLFSYHMMLALLLSFREITNQIENRDV